MQYVSCGKGHFYDPDEYKSCPQCARESGTQPQFVMDDLGATEPLNNVPNFGGQSAGGMDSVGVTEPVNGAAAPIATSVPFPGETLETTFFQDPIPGAGVDSYGPTMPVGSFSNPGDSQSGTTLPVVGWLVCI